MNGTPKTSPRVAVMGAGAMGSLYGAALTEAGVETVLIDVDPRLTDHLAEHGVRLRRDGRETVVRLDVRADAADLAPVDLVVFFVKAYATGAAAALIAPAVDERTVALSLQNGWGAGERLLEAFAADRIVVGVSYQSATVRELGLVERTAGGATVIGPLQDGAGAVEVARAILARGDLEPRVSPDVIGDIWEKLVLNTAANPTAALARLPAAELTKVPEMRELVEAVARETIAVANAIGHEIDPADALRHIEATLVEAGDGKGSMLQDVESGRRTEIEVITGAVLRAADQERLEVPLNRAIFALIRGYEWSRGLA